MNIFPKDDIQLLLQRFISQVISNKPPETNNYIYVTVKTNVPDFPVRVPGANG